MIKCNKARNYAGLVAYFPAHLAHTSQISK